MSQTSARLSLPYLQPAQAQKHVTHNEALQRLDGLVQLVLEAVDRAAPPTSAVVGAAFGTSAAPQGDWSAQPQKIAIWQGEGWLFLTPQEGWRAWHASQRAPLVWRDGAWHSAAPEETEQLGIGTRADTTNRLSVASDAVLLSHAGAGHQLKINKASAGDTASLLFQAGFSGQAELGLAGSNAFSVKTTRHDGSWRTALAVSADVQDIGIGTQTPGARLDIRSDVTADLLRAGPAGTPLFRLQANGNGSCAGSWTGGGADYAEFCEWHDGNPDAEDRRGLSVVFEGEKIRPAQKDEVPVGVISAAPCVLGNDDMGSWRGRYQRDAFGTLQRDADGMPIEHPDYDPTLPYVPRSERAEWAMVGFLGRLYLRPDQPVDPRWQCLRRATPGRAALWFLR